MNTSFSRLRRFDGPSAWQEVLHVAGPADLAPIDPGVPPTNLPVQLTTFVGREAECAEVKRLLAEVRLLTLTGAGGVGKTRLALEVAAELVDPATTTEQAYPDGVWLVELASLADPALVPWAVAFTLSVSEVSGQPLAATLTSVLRPRQLLLILDNCEHLAAACAELAERLLRACPHLLMLATSRESLRVPGETVWRVPSLSIPDPRVAVGTDEIASSEAVGLFIERARSALPSFVLQDHNAAAVAQICRRLDGIALAVELAAARVKVLSPEQIAARLDDRFRLLSGGSRLAPSRQQTLWATLDWSYELLSESERVLFLRLAVFAGGWTLEAAESICAFDAGTSALSPHDVLELLGHLVDKSLVMADTQSGNDRYWMLETIRAYGQQHLIASGEADTVQRRHAEHFLRLAEEAAPALWGPEQSNWSDRLEREHDNLRAALRWSLASGAAETSVRLGGALGYFWMMRAHRREGQWWLEQALAASGGVSILPRARAVAWVGRLADNRSDYQRTTAAYEESLALLRQLRQLGHRRELATLLEELGRVDRRRGDYQQAAAHTEESLALWRELGDAQELAGALSALGLVASAQGDYAAAEDLYLESLALRRELGDRHQVAHVLDRLGVVVRNRGDPQRATGLHQESLTLFRDLGCKEGVADSLDHLARLLGQGGDGRRALVLCAESLALYDELDAKRALWECMETVAGILVAEGRPERAARLLGVAEALRESIGSPLPPADRAEHERVVGAIRSTMSKPAFAAAWAEGRAMPLEQAVEYAKAQAVPGAGPVQGRGPASETDPLSHREREVAILIARGLTNHEIAAALVISRRTAEAHVTHMLGKLGLRSRAQVAIWAMEHGLLATQTA